MVKRTDEETLLEEARKRFEFAEDSERENRDLAGEDFEFLAGEQWPEDVESDREANDQPCLTINRLPQFVRQVTGDARQNKPAIKVHPVDDKADPDTAKVYSGLIRQIEIKSRATSAYITALEHACAGGFGHWRVTTEYSDDDTFDQDIRVKRIRNPFSVYWDSNSTEYDHSDAMWCFVTDWITKEEFERRYPNETPSDWETEYRRENALSWLDEENVRIAEYWVKKPVRKRFGLLADGRTVELDGKQLPPDMQVVRQRVVDTFEVVQYILSGHKVLEGPSKWAGKYIPVITCTGPEEFIDGRIRYLSVIRYAKDPQRMYNYWQSAITEKVALAPKAPFIGTAKQFAQHQEFWARANKDNLAFLPYTPDPEAPGPPQRQAPATMNVAEIQQSAQSIDDLKATTGIYDASLGARGNETSGRAIIARQKEGDTSTYAWIDNLARSIEHTGRILVDLIPRIYDTERQIRILGEDGESEFVPINQPVLNERGEVVYLHDLAAGKYDVDISTGPSFSTRRDEAVTSLTEIVRSYPAAAPVLIPIIAKHMDWPQADEISELLKKLAPPGVFDDGQPPDPMQMQMQQMQMDRAMEELRKLKVETDSKIAVIEKTQMETQGKQFDMAAKAADTDYTQARTQSEMIQVRNREAEAEGKEIDNAAKMMELAMRTPAFQQAVEAEVMRIVQGISQQPVR